MRRIARGYPQQRSPPKKSCETHTSMKRTILIIGLLARLTGCAFDTSSEFPTTQTIGYSREIVMLDGAAREDIEAHATLESWHEGSGLAIVGALDDTRRAALRATPGVSGVYPDDSVALDADAPVYEPSPMLERQWHLSAIGADAAWSAGRYGSRDVTVAVLDTGIDYTHRDLEGLVDLSRSRSFVPTDDARVRELYPDRHEITDLHQHGTHVASTIASHGALTAGMTRHVTLIGVKVLDENAEGEWSAIIEGVLYAVDQGADVINVSLGASFERARYGRFAEMVQRTARYAEAHGALLVVAAGNEGRDLDHDGEFHAFCDAPNVLCVGATGPATSAGIDGPHGDVDAPAAYSNRGSHVDVTAPGGAAAPVWGACSSTSRWLPECEGGEGVVGLTGTSMAVPHVSGLAALMVEDHRRDPAAIRWRIVASARDLGAHGRDPHYGRGLIDVAAALARR
jgi:subtilisin family serine protease